MDAFFRLKLKGIHGFNETFEKMATNCHESKIFRTQKLHIGLGTSVLREGDQIWLLAGSKVPFILRKHPDGHTTLIGEAYVDGMMY